MAPLTALLVLPDTAAALTAICRPACWPKAVSAWASGWDGMSNVVVRPAWASRGAGSMAGDCADAWAAMHTPIVARAIAASSNFDDT